MKNICFLNTDFGMGGMQKVSWFLGSHLNTSYNVFYFSFHSKNNYFEIPTDQLYFPESIVTSYPVIRMLIKIPRLIESAVRGQFSPYRYEFMQLRSLTNFLTCNEIHTVVISGNYLTSLIPEIKKKCPKTKIIAWQHNNYKTYVENYSSKFIESYIEGVRSADNVVCLTSSDLEEFGKLNRNSLCIYNPLTTGSNSENKKQFIDKSKSICFVGRIDFDHKGIDYLLEIAKKLPQGWVINIAGDGNKNEIKLFYKEIRKNKLEPKINYLGALKSEQLREMYTKGYIYIMTSRWEGMPLVLAEAMSFGLPVVAFSQTGSREVLDNGKYGILVDNGNIDAMVAKLLQLYNNNGLWKSFSKLSLKRSYDFDINKVLKEWYKIL